MGDACMLASSRITATPVLYRSPPDIRTVCLAGVTEVFSIRVALLQLLLLLLLTTYSYYYYRLEHCPGHARSIDVRNFSRRRRN